jgi:hypothetical protein
MHILHDGIGTLSLNAGQVAKASPGHYPLPFWISAEKNCSKDKGRQKHEPKLIGREAKPLVQQSKQL